MTRMTIYDHCFRVKSYQILYYLCHKLFPVVSMQDPWCTKCHKYVEQEASNIFRLFTFHWLCPGESSKMISCMSDPSIFSIWACPHVYEINLQKVVSIYLANFKYCKTILI